MTIAACYLSPEGVVLGADSASTYAFDSGPHHFNYGQKLFEIGGPENGTVGLVTWGLGGLSLGSYRTFAARLADDLVKTAASSVEDVARRWIDSLWPSYVDSDEVKHLKLLDAKPPFDDTGNDANRTDEEEALYTRLRYALVAGFCIAGYVLPDRSPAAFEIIFDPLGDKPVPSRLEEGHYFWGVPSIINRILRGYDDHLRDAILDSGNWSGTESDLDWLLSEYRIEHPRTVPIREAIDFTHAALLTTIKAMKFSLRPRFCGGPIEIAVITTDRPFRWVQHKQWNAAIKESDS